MAIKLKKSTAIAQDGVTSTDPPLLPHEDAKAYEALQTRVRAEVEPADVFEEIWTQDVIELIWEIRRLKRIQTRIVAIAVPDAVYQIAAQQDSSDGVPAPALSVGWAKNEKEVVAQVKKMLHVRGLSEDDLEAEAFRLRIDELATINHMIVQAEARRNRAIEDIDRHREVLAAKLRRAAEYEDAQYEEIATEKTVVV